MMRLLRRSLPSLALGLLVGASACTHVPVAQPVGRPEAPIGPRVRLQATLPPGMPGTGTAVAIAFTPEEVQAGLPQDLARWGELLARAQVARGVEAEDGVLTVDVAVPARPAVVRLVFDSVGLGLDALFDARPGLASAMVSVPEQDALPLAALAGEPYAPPPEACVGERETLVVIDAPETRRPGDDGQRPVCVRVPPSYASAPERRYPVIFIFPGFSGWHASNNTWRQRALLEAVGAELGVEAILVGVSTRTAEGTSYLEDAPGFGDWDRYASQHLVQELDARFRTLPRRATVGHSTGGWNALSLALRHPDVFLAAAASSPDALDLDVWLLAPGEPQVMRPEWLAWTRVEAALGGRGQMTSYGAAWSPDPAAQGGFQWPVDLATGALRPDVYARWRARSPRAGLETEAGRAAARRLSGHLLITAGSKDEFGLFAPAASYVEAARAAGVDVTWLPTELGHFGGDEARFTPIARFLYTQLRAE
jgi:S-formylglutathione hydrolase FrmB